MKRILTILFFLLSIAAAGQKSFIYVQRDTAIGIDTPMRTGATLNEFGNTHFIDYPRPGVTTDHPPNLYSRWKFCEIMTGFNTFNFSDIDAKFNTAIDRGQLLGIGFEPISDYATCNTISGAVLSYPTYVHTQMQGETVKDWIAADGNQWVPNWNSTYWQQAWDYLLRRVRGHLDSTFHNGHKYSDYIDFVDSREFGNYGEDHTYGAGHTNTIPAGAQATDASLKTLFNSVRTWFPDKRIIININALYGSHPDSDVPASFGYYLLTEANSQGRFGIRVDHVGNPGPFTAKDYTQNTTTYNGLSFKTEIGNRYKESMMLGEPEQSGYQQAGQCDYSFTRTYITTLHLSMIENANIVTASTPCVQSGFRSYAKLLGYRYSCIAGQMDQDSLVQNGNITFRNTFINKGIAPTYYKWNITYELRQGSNVIWSGLSTLQLQVLMATTSQVDNFTLPANLGGNHAQPYNLYMIIRDPFSIMAPMPLDVTTPSRNADGSYLLQANLYIASTGSNPPPPPPPPPNQVPVIIMGGYQTDTLPKSTDTLTAQVSDPNGDAVSIAWTQNPGGPNTATMSAPTSLFNVISGLIEGTYSFRLTANDGKGGIAIQDIIVYVVDVTAPPQPQPPPPVYAPPTITIPGDTIVQYTADSAYLRVIIADTGSTAAHDTTIASIQWFLYSYSGTTVGTIVSPTSEITKVTGLTPAANANGIYQYYVRVTDKAGNIVTSTGFRRVIILPVDIPDPTPLPPDQLPTKYSGKKQAF